MQLGVEDDFHLLEKDTIVLFALSIVCHHEVLLLHPLQDFQLPLINQS